MENASKALIIAGAILISIVLITLGVVIIGQGQDTVNKSNIDDQVVSTWNQKFTQYVGSDVTGTTVNTLVNSVLSSNAISNNNGEYNKLITLTTAGNNQLTFSSATAKDSTTSYTSQCTKKAVPAAKYTISVTYGTDGFITGIKVTGK